ncbi:MAG TPA: hypothetical protein VNX68_13615, partial [Nitrosopumilaceae archaeon]|nr:hypothetical protein [Nitrosopumilaceae archaeon]
MRNIYIFIFFLISSIDTFAQAPNWQWAERAGGVKRDEPFSITTDASGNVYMVGGFASSSITFGSTTLTNSSTYDEFMYLVKYDPSGNVLWARKSIGGIYLFASVTTDASGNVYVAGSFNSTSGSLTFGSVTITSSADKNIFLVKYDSSGNVIWAKNDGKGMYNDPSVQNIVRAITTDGGGNVFVGGYWFAANTPNGYANIFGGDTLFNSYAGEAYQQVFLVKYDASGNVLWAKSGGGDLDDNATSIDTDASGNVYLSGSFCSKKCIFGPDTLSNFDQSTGAGYQRADMYLVKYSASGNVLWARSAGGINNTYGCSASFVTADATGNTYFTGTIAPNTTFGSFTLTGFSGQA